MQADLNLRWASISEGTFSDFAANTEKVNHYNSVRYQSKMRNLFI